MLTKEGEARNIALDLNLATLLAAIAGALNAAGFHAFGLFSANMTGNVSALSDHVGLGEMWRATFYFAIVVLFVAGAGMSTLLINAGRRRGLVGVYAFSILFEALALIGLEIGDMLLPDAAHGVVLIYGLSFLMGLQNATVTRISNARIRTTHVSGMSTDIGIELAMLFDMALGREPRAEREGYRTRLRLHGQTVLAFLGGGIVGVMIYQFIGTRLLFIASGVLGAVALFELMRQRRRPKPAPI